jgi:hypothetical protein
MGSNRPTSSAGHIGKYFSNSVREDGFLSVAKGGIIYAEGSGGTVQEIFADAAAELLQDLGRQRDQGWDEHAPPAKRMDHDWSGPRDSNPRPRVWEALPAVDDAWGWFGTEISVPHQTSPASPSIR